MAVVQSKIGREALLGCAGEVDLYKYRKDFKSARGAGPIKMCAPAYLIILHNEHTVKWISY